MAHEVTEKLFDPTESQTMEASSRRGEVLLLRAWAGRHDVGAQSEMRRGPQLGGRKSRIESRVRTRGEEDAERDQRHALCLRQLRSSSWEQRAHVGMRRCGSGGDQVRMPISARVRRQRVHGEQLVGAVSGTSDSGRRSSADTDLYARSAGWQKLEPSGVTVRAAEEARAREVAGGSNARRSELNVRVVEIHDCSVRARQSHGNSTRPGTDTLGQSSLIASGAREQHPTPLCRTIPAGRDQARTLISMWLTEGGTWAKVRAELVKLNARRGGGLHERAQSGRNTRAEFVPGMPLELYKTAGKSGGRSSKLSSRAEIQSAEEAAKCAHTSGEVENGVRVAQMQHAAPARSSPTSGACGAGVARYLSAEVLISTSALSADLDVNGRVCTRAPQAAAEPSEGGSARALGGSSARTSSREGNVHAHRIIVSAKRSIVKLESASTAPMRYSASRRLGKGVTRTEILAAESGNLDVPRCQEPLESSENPSRAKFEAQMHSSTRKMAASSRD
ncbi:hypothetical protein C8F04DRAFT_1340414 [Mycena alexandri]|uniref:Uncharacterized protein n=1 Tax=Mycena alexandri TaxID=1745969 RepID=A0AAD6SXR5_9AGAR|nr:hypothetical protein C8F04DRAFT_1340414 [Mycena alexandri]